MRDIDERTNLAANSMFELLLFRLGEAPARRGASCSASTCSRCAILVMPEITAMVNMPPSVMGGGQHPRADDHRHQPAQGGGLQPHQGLGILLVTEFARTTQAFAVEEVNEIVRLGGSTCSPPKAVAVAW